MDQIYEHIALRVETTAHCLVGMHPAKFLDEFLPGDTPTPEAYGEKAPTKKSSEEIAVGPFQTGEVSEHDARTICELTNDLKSRDIPSQSHALILDKTRNLQRVS
jgi:hypothetical protein